MGVHGGVEPSGKEIGEADVGPVDFGFEFRDVDHVARAPIGAGPGDAGLFPMVEDDGLAAIDAAGEIDVALFGIIEPGKLPERDAVELEVPGIAIARRDPAADAVADAMMRGDGLREPAQMPRPAEGRVFGIEDEKGKMAVLGGERAGEDAGSQEAE